jgi:hypothetical protein
MQRITQNAQTSSVPCQLTYLKCVETAGAENCPWRHVLDCPAASKIAAIDACAGKHRAPHRASVLTRRSPGVVGQGTAESMG